MNWEVKPQKKVRGRSFKLTLPGEETTILALEVPRDFIPSVRMGRRHGPFAARTAEEDAWEIEAESGRIELELYDPDLAPSPATSNLWVSGATRIESGGALMDREDWPTGPPIGRSSSIRAISTPLEVELLSWS